MLKEKVRVYALARELKMESKDLLDLCRDAGMDLKNQLSSLDPDQKDMIVDLVKKGGSASAPSRPSRSSAPVLPPVHKKSIRNLSRTPPQVTSAEKQDESSAASSQVEDAESAISAETRPQGDEDVVESASDAAAQESPSATATSVVESERGQEDHAEMDSTGYQTLAEDEADGSEDRASAGSESQGADMPESSGSQQDKVRTPAPDKKIRDLGGPRSARDKQRPRPRVARPSPPSIPVAKPPKKTLISRKVQKEKEEKTQTPVSRFSREMLERAREKVIRPEDIMEPDSQRPPVIDYDEEEGGKGKDKKRKSAVGDRQKRKEAREKRAQQRRQQGDLSLDTQVLEEEPRTGRRTGQRRQRKPRGQVAQPRTGRVSIELPITVRSLSEALGMKSVQLLFKLRDHTASTMININSVLEPEIAEDVALDVGCELDIKRPPDAEEKLLESLQEPDEREKLQPRAPIVTVMGHVDHGKTSLLDRIRKSNVVDTEAGGITQVIRAWRVEHEGKLITFLDTPGHEAFTKMRARGAEVTDIAVIVVAADDGVMPQTEEAIDHAKAAGVSLVIAINKIDVPNANIDKTRQQLYSLSVLPDNMGGDTPFVETSAASGVGIDELLEAISLVAELKELQANPDKPGSGVCLEAMLSEGEGVLATLLVRQGTVHRGDVVLCGASFGRIRQLYNDQGKPIESAGPSEPVRITGLDVVPNADDPFYIVPDLATARDIADKRKVRQREYLHTSARSAVDLLQLSDQPIEKLNVIIKADFRGSIEAIRKELDKLQHDEVEVNILRSGIGGISESDVQLALTSPQNTMIVGFNVVPDDRAKMLADEKGVSLRQYNVIYMLTDDIKAALEGKLKPRQEVVHLGRAVVRDTFKISRVGTIAGCYVTQGIIKRSAKVRIIRNGVVIYPPADRSAGLDSLKRFKDDVAEVREGFECGIKVAGYDDIKVDDVIEAYRIEEIQRTLDQS